MPGPHGEGGGLRRLHCRALQVPLHPREGAAQEHHVRVVVGWGREALLLALAVSHGSAEVAAGVDPLAERLAILCHPAVLPPHLEPLRGNGLDAFLGAPVEDPRHRLSLQLLLLPIKGELRRDVLPHVHRRDLDAPVLPVQGDPGHLVERVRVGGVRVQDVRLPDPPHAHTAWQPLPQAFESRLLLQPLLLRCVLPPAQATLQQEGGGALLDRCPWHPSQPPPLGRIRC
mmetsp:Transcript_44807/g.112388  ORF Transcript_44807/g.112388 Transcript_44807/m.112388 type:complete len:229 (-) Transcript_44807:383-1069(-)